MNGHHDPLILEPPHPRLHGWIPSLSKTTSLLRIRNKQSISGCNLEVVQPRECYRRFYLRLKFYKRDAGASRNHADLLEPMEGLHERF